MWLFRTARRKGTLDLSSQEGKNYVIENFKDPKSREKHSQVITVQEGNCLGLSKWKGEFVPEKMFKIQPCSDNAGENCVVTVYNSLRQWKVSSEVENRLEVVEYSCPSGRDRGGGDDDDERLRPRLGCWRFAFQECDPPGTKKYRIFSMDDDLIGQGKNYLCVTPPDSHGIRELSFTARNEDDPSQLWCLYQR